MSGKNRTRRLSPTDKIFLLSESSTVMVHVGGLLTLRLPEGSAEEWIGELLKATNNEGRVCAPWNLKLTHPDFLKHPAQSWVEDDAIDLGYHVRRVAVAAPGDARALHATVSGLHSRPVDFHRPPWEVVLLEGLEDGRVAVYVKLHHALIDGFTGSKILSQSLSTDPDALDAPLFVFKSTSASRARTQHTLWETASTQLRAVPRAVGALRKFWKSATQDRIENPGASRAPKSILNGRITTRRSFSTQRFCLERIKLLAELAGGTINDIVLALCAGALRRFLQEMGELPDEPLVAMVPVNIRPEDDPGGGNSVGALLTSLATDIREPAARLQAIMSAINEGKSRMQGLPQAAMLQYSALQLIPTGAQHFGGIGGWVRPQFNIIISNVPGPSEPLYYRGARLEASFPVSLPFHGQALNISCASSADSLNFGLIACRDTVPNIDRLAYAMRETFDELVEVFGGD